MIPRLDLMLSNDEICPDFGDPNLDWKFLWGQSAIPTTHVGEGQSGHPTLPASSSPNQLVLEIDGWLVESEWRMRCDVGMTTRWRKLKNFFTSGVGNRCLAPSRVGCGVSDAILWEQCSGCDAWFQWASARAPEGVSLSKQSMRIQIQLTSYGVWIHKQHSR